MSISLGAAALMAGIGAAGNIAGSLIGNRANKKEAQKNRDFQQDMSNTSVQRRVQDLKQAGLNPLLAVGSASQGASTPSGNVANLDYSGIGNGITSGLQMYQAMRQNEANINKTEADTALVKQKQITEGIDQANKSIDTELKRMGIYSEKLNQKLKGIQSEQALKNLIKTDKELQKLDTEQIMRLVNLKRMEWELEVDQTDPANTLEGRKALHLKRTAASNQYELGYMLGKHLMDKPMPKTTGKTNKSNGMWVPDSYGRGNYQR